MSKQNVLERNRAKWSRGGDSAPSNGDWLKGMARQTGKTNAVRQLVEDRVRGKQSRVVVDLVQVGDARVQGSSADVARRPTPQVPQDDYGNIYRILPEACKFLPEGNDDGVFHSGTIVGAIKHKPTHYYKYLMFHIIAEDGSRHTVHGKRVFEAEAAFETNTPVQKF